MERSIVFLLLATMLLAAQPAKSQSDDFGMWYEVGVEKKLSKKWNVALEGELRTRNDSKTTDRWTVGLSTEYKIVKGLKASVGYVFLSDNNAEKLTFKSDGYTPKKWTPGYWSTRHRFTAGLTGSVDWKRFTFSLRERWQYTYRPEYTVDQRWSYYDNAYDGKPKTYESKNVHVLRSRLQVEYDKKGLAVTPYASVEFFNGWSLQKTRFQTGLDWKVSKQHTLGFFYRYQTVRDDEDDLEPNRHMIGIGYKFKF